MPKYGRKRPAQAALSVYEDRFLDLAVHGMGAANSIHRYGECMPDCRVLEMPTLDHELCGKEHHEAEREVVNFLRDA